jgi:hypothetical protein
MPQLFSRLPTRSLNTLGAAVLLLAGAAHADSHAPAFAESELLRVQQRYAPGILENFYEVILPRLEPEDAAKLKDVTISFPLRVEGIEPFAFFAAGQSVTMSASSILFLDEMATAAGWLNAKGYAQSSLTDYASMLKYGKLGANPPTPLKALCIPANAMDDPKAKNTADQGFNVGVIFILLHELGHVLHQHPGYLGIDPAVARQNEQEADLFALDGLKRLDAVPLAMVQYFTVMAHMASNRGDFDSDEEFATFLSGRTHPLDSGRIALLAKSMQQDPGMAALAGQILGQITATLELPGIQEIMATAGETAVQANLAPRRLNEKLGTPCGWSDDGQDFSGPHDGTMRQENTDFEVSYILRRSGTRVTGAASFGIATYAIEGEVTGNNMGFRWTASDVTGRGTLTLQPDRSLVGTWGNGQSESDGGPLTLQRRPVE